MSAAYDREAARFSAIQAFLPHAGPRGWCLAALREVAGPDADLLFPGGPPEMVDTYLRLADLRMVAATAPSLGNLKLSQRVRSLILARLRQAELEKPAVRRALGLLSLPSNMTLGVQTLSRTVDEIWMAAGDQSADFSWYTKRVILASVYSATLLYWLNDDAGMEAVGEFLDRRMAAVAQITRLRRRFLQRAA
jgi:ubiquinone biosynthesis protein COQ9